MAVNTLAASWPARWKQVFLKKSGLTMRYIQIWKLCFLVFQWMTRISNRKGNLDPIMIIIRGQGQVRCFMENEKNLKTVKDVLNVSIDRERGCVCKTQDGNEVASPRFCFPWFWGWIWWLFFWGGFMDCSLWWCNYLRVLTTPSILYSFSGIGCARLDLSDKDF